MEKILKFRAVAMAVGALLYGASPIDLLPDLIPVIGQLDDVLIVPTMLLMAYVAWQRGNKAKMSAAPNGAGAQPVEFIPPANRVSTRR